MTQNQLIQEYEFDPTLTTRELSALETAKAIAECEEALRKSFYMTDRDAYKAVATKFNGDVEKAIKAVRKMASQWEQGNGYARRKTFSVNGVEFKVFLSGKDAEDYFDNDDEFVDVSDEFKAIKAECKALVDRMPFDRGSAQRVKATVDGCDTANQLFWNFFFNFYQEDIEKDMAARFPDVMEDLGALQKRNAERYVRD